MIQRRAFVAGMASTLVTARLAEAQQARTMSRVAVLHVNVLHPSEPRPAFDAFRHALVDLGWIEGQTVVSDYRAAGGAAERLHDVAAEIVRSNPDVIVTGVTLAAVAAKRATSMIPIVMAVSVDPVGLGLVKSLARPGGISVSGCQTSTDGCHRNDSKLYVLRTRPTNGRVDFEVSSACSLVRIWIRRGRRLDELWR